MARHPITGYKDKRPPSLLCGATFIGLLFILVSLACSKGVTTSSTPFFAVAGSATLTPKVSIFDPSPTTLLPTETPTVEPTPATPSPTPTLSVAENPPLLYYAQAGDTLSALGVRFGVEPYEIDSPHPITDTGMLPPNQMLMIPDRLENTTPSQRLIPDSEVIFSPSAVNFDVRAFVKAAGGYLSEYRELYSISWLDGAGVVEKVARDNSINPRLILALLEYQSGWVYGRPGNLALTDYPMGEVDTERKGLYKQLAWAVNQISIGYYGWREGLLTNLQFSDGISTPRLAPSLNAGTVALQYYLSQIYDTTGWLNSLDPNNGFPALYVRMFGDPWIRALDVEPLFPAGLAQPRMVLPFMIGQMWSYTGGPHGAWEHDGARAALDFAPGSDEVGCSDTDTWAIAAAPGRVIRSENGLVVIDLDDDGIEQTGWVLIYLHIADKGRIEVGEEVETGDLIGHPSCIGGYSTGRHIHIVRKFNGEWISADGPLPFVLSGWTAHAGENPYQGTLTRGSDTVIASIYGSFESRIIRQHDDP